MNKSIWHRYDEAPKHQDIIMTDTGCWAYRADLLSLEIENKDHSDKIRKLEMELDRTRKALEMALDWLGQVATPEKCDDNLCREFTKRKLTEIKTALEQKESAFVHNKIEFPEFNDNLLEEFDKQFFENGQDDDLTETALEQKDK